MRLSEDLQDVFWTSNIRSIYVLCPGGKLDKKQSYFSTLTGPNNGLIYSINLVTINAAFTFDYKGKALISVLSAVLSIQALRSSHQ